MTTYYVSPYGSDSNNGLGPDAHDSTNKPWLTFGKLLGAAGFASGDTGYICPGTYRETVAVAMTSATGTTSVLGDPGNAQGFKDNNGVLVPGGDVILSAYLTNDLIRPTTVALMDLAGRDFLTFQFIIFMIGETNSYFTASTKTSTDITISDCAFHNAGIQPTPICFVSAGPNIALNWTITRCYILANTSTLIQFTVDTPATADFDLNVNISNCFVIVVGAPAAFVLTADGVTTNTFKYGGIHIYNCTLIGQMRTLSIGTANHSTSIPSTVYNCFALLGSNTFVGANTLGQILEDYNYFLTSGTARTNVAVGAHSKPVGNPALEIGQSYVTGRQPRPFGSGNFAGIMAGQGAHSGGPAVDIFNRPRPSGMYLASSGTATSGAAKTLTDTAQAWGVNAFRGWTVQITGGPGSGQTKSIASNTATVITVDGNWQTNPDNTSTYQVYWGDLSSTGKATAGAATTVTDSNAAWGTNQWTGYTVSITGGIGSGQTAVVVTNTATVLTCPASAFSPSPDSTSTYSLYKSVGVTHQEYAAGAFERHDQGQRDSVTYDVSPTAVRLMGMADMEITLPVDATSTTISIRNRFDTAHGTGSPPDVVLLASGEIGVTTQTVAAAANANTWQTITLSAINPTAKGYVTLRLRSHAAASNGLCWFDTLAVA